MNTTTETAMTFVLDQILANHRDAEARLHAAAQRTRDPQLYRLFTRMASARRQFAEQIERELVRSGEETASGGSLRGGIRRILTAVRSFVSGGETSVDLEECEAGARFELSDLRRALASDLLESRVRKILERHGQAVEEDLDRLAELASEPPGAATAPPPEATPGRMDCYGMSSRGGEREENEDQFLIAELGRSLHVHQTSLPSTDQLRFPGNGSTQGHLLLVADGMGGEAGGRTASRIATVTAARYILDVLPLVLRLDDDRASEPRGEFRHLLEACESSIARSSREQPELRGMGTTLTLACVLWPRAYVAHVGDSRCYLHRDGRLERVTTDHTVAQRLAEEDGPLSGSPPSSRLRDVLWNVLGGHRDGVDGKVHSVDLRLGDSLLLCTDGLPRSVPEPEILRRLETCGSAEEVTRGILTAARSRDANDDTTVVVARFDPLDPQPVPVRDPDTSSATSAIPLPGPRAGAGDLTVTASPADGAGSRPTSLGRTFLN